MSIVLKLIAVFTITSFLLLDCTSSKHQASTLKDAFDGKFLIGVAVNTHQVDGKDILAKPIIKKHFDSLVVENGMKSEKKQTEQGVFTFDDADKFVSYGKANNKFIIGLYPGYPRFS
jgi:endo-1,4-beta-xylanase